MKSLFNFAVVSYALFISTATVSIARRGTDSCGLLG